MGMLGQLTSLDLSFFICGMDSVQVPWNVNTAVSTAKIPKKRFDQVQRETVLFLHGLPAGWSLSFLPRGMVLLYRVNKLTQGCTLTGKALFGRVVLGTEPKASFAADKCSAAEL